MVACCAFSAYQLDLITHNRTWHLFVISLITLLFANGISVLTLVLDPMNAAPHYTWEIYRHATAILAYTMMLIAFLKLLIPAYRIFRTEHEKTKP